MMWAYRFFRTGIIALRKFGTFVKLLFQFKKSVGVWLLVQPAVHAADGDGKELPGFVTTLPGTASGRFCCHTAACSQPAPAISRPPYAKCLPFGDRLLNRKSARHSRIKGIQFDLTLYLRIMPT